MRALRGGNVCWEPQLRPQSVQTVVQAAQEGPESPPRQVWKGLRVGRKGGVERGRVRHLLHAAGFGPAAGRRLAWEEEEEEEEEKQKQTEDKACQPIQAMPPPAGGAGAGASAVGDPHLQNIHGERFDLMKAGKHVLINIPRGMSAENALLRVQADARRLGGQCADMYFQQVNVTGSWAEAKQVGGLHYSVSQHDAKAPEWVAFGKVELKVVHGRTDSGLLYLNLYVKHLGRAGFAVGGLLGEDDHEDVSAAPESCSQRLALVAGGDGGPRAASSASASLE